MSSKHMIRNFEQFLRHINRLDWLRVTGLNDATLQKHISAVVKKIHKANSRRSL